MLKIIHIFCNQKQYLQVSAVFLLVSTKETICNAKHWLGGKIAWTIMWPKVTKLPQLLTRCLPQHHPSPPTTKNFLGTSDLATSNHHPTPPHLGLSRKTFWDFKSSTPSPFRIGYSHGETIGETMLYTTRLPFRSTTAFAQ